MTVWKCPRCHYETEYKQRMKTHLSRQYECKAEFDDTDCVTIMEDMFPEKKKPFRCPDCKKGFSHSPGLSRHKHVCPYKMDNLVMKVAKELMKKGGMTTVINNNITNITNNVHNGHNIVQINAFGNEDTTHIDKAFLDQVVRRREKGLIELVQKLHFDESVPGNRNLRIRNKKSNLMEYHDGRKWKYEDKSKVLTEVMDKGHTILQDHFDECKSNLRSSIPRFWYDAICDWFVKTRDGKTEEANSALRGLYLMILNESSLS